MTVQSGSQAVFGTATPIVSIPSGQSKSKVKICNYDSGSIYLGGKNVTAAGAGTKGILLASNGVMEFELGGGDILYGVSSTALTASVTAITDEGEVAVTAIADDGYAAITAFTTNGTTMTCAAVNNYSAGNHVTIVNATEPTFNLVNALIATASGADFTILTVVTGITSTADAHTVGKLNTITYTAANAFAPADVVSILAASSAEYNLTGATVDTASGSQFTIKAILNAVGTTSTADARLTAGNLITFTATNTFAVGDVVVISAATSPEYNVQGIITARSGSMFKFIAPVTSGTTSTATATRTGTVVGGVAFEYSA